MNNFTKNAPFIASIFICSSTIAMEPALIPVQCLMMITEHRTPATMYASSDFHAAVFEHNKLQSTIKDPIQIFKVKELSTNTKFDFPLPAKYCLNLTDGSLLELFESNQYGLFKGIEHLENKPLLLRLLCTVNPKLPGESFDEQHKNTRIQFYKNPGSPWVSKNNISELENAGITMIAGTMLMPSDCWIINPDGVAEQTMRIREVFSHGPNGCSDEETLRKSATTANIEDVSEIEIEK